MSKTDARKIDALDQWCLRMLLGIRWYQFVWNDDVWRLTKQPKLTAIIQSRRLTLFEHIMRMDDNANAKSILLASPPADWRRQLGRPRIVPASHGSAPSNRIWNITILRSPKQQIWLRTALCGGWCRCMVGATPLWVACQKRRRRFAHQRRASSGLWSRDVEHVSKRRSYAVSKLYTPPSLFMQLGSFRIQIDSLTCLVFLCPSVSKILAPDQFMTWFSFATWSVMADLFISAALLFRSTVWMFCC